MKNVKTKKKGYLPRLMSSLQNLWSAKEMLSLRHIRPAFLPYFFAFPLAMVFVNIQDLIWGEGGRAFGLSYTTITFLGFAMGAIAIFALTSRKNCSAMSRLSAALIVAGFASWLLLPAGDWALVGSVFLMAGVGGCMSCSSFSFVFLLNNAERFFSVALMLLLIKLIELGAVAGPFHPAVKSGLAALLLIFLCLCMLLSKRKDYEGTGEKAIKRFNASIWLTLFLFLSYFAIRITGFYTPAFSHPSTARLWGIFALALLLICVLQQALLGRSVWTLCNVFFLSSILSYAMWYLGAPEAAYLCSELKDIGFLTAFYLIGCVTNKFCDFRMHKRLVLISLTAVGLLYVGIDALHERTLDQPIAIRWLHSYSRSSCCSPPRFPSICFSPTGRRSLGGYT